MKPGETGGTWEVSWDEENERGTVHRIRRVNGIPMPVQEGRIFKGEAARERRREVQGE